MNTPENPPAFPRAGTVTQDKFGNYVTEEAPAQGGISTRDFFAAAALQGLLAADVQQQHSAMKLADWSYQQADAMLAERQKQKESR